jgi:ferric iron reductase protein FhuF
VVRSAGGGQTGLVTAAVQAAVAARVPGAAALGLLPPPSAPAVPAALFADPGWTADRLAALGARYASDDRRVLATVWWYSASSVLLTPALAGLATGLPLSARLADTSVALLGGGTPIAATSSAPGTDTAAELRESLAAVVDAVAGARFTRRVSCCLLYRLPPEPLCTSCPRRPAAERELLLEDTAARMR